MSSECDHDLTKALAEALGCDATMDDEGDYYCSEHGDYLHHTGQCLEAERIAAALAPLIEARVREVEEQRDEVSGRLSELLCDLTGGLLSKPGYDVPTMVQAVEEHFERTVVAVAWDEGYRSGHSNAMRRMSDEPSAPTTPNPYREDARDA